ncbi:hypothetical protein GJ496_012053 [Pomphorhynchus laevis]|nr:hypothetical protein GJ496_012053 [Pomphorhynchus laevis]
MWNEGNLATVNLATAATVAKFTRMGWIGNASRLLTENWEASLVSLDHMIGETTVHEKLAFLYPMGEHVHTECLLRAPLHNWVQHHESRFHELNAEDIICAARSVRVRDTISAEIRKIGKLVTQKYAKRITRVEQGSFYPIVYPSVGGVGPGANQIMQTISKCRASRSHLDYISQLRQYVSIQIAKCASMALRMRAKAEHILFSNDNNICSYV